MYKKIKYLAAFLMIAGLTAMVSCVDDEKNPLPETTRGAYPQFTTYMPGAINPTDVFKGTIIDYNEKISNIKYSLKYTSAAGDVIEKENIIEVTSLPYELSLGRAELAGFLGLAEDKLSYGDNFELSAVVEGKDGTIFNANTPGFKKDKDGNVIKDENENPIITGGNLGSKLKTAGYKQAMKFNWYYSCPFNIEEALGTYIVDGNPWTGEENGEVEMVKGNAPNQVVMKDIFVKGFDLVLEIDEATGIVSVNTDKPSFYHGKYGDGRCKDAQGFFFSCTGTLDVSFDFTVAAGSFGRGGFVAKKK